MPTPDMEQGKTDIRVTIQPLQLPQFPLERNLQALADVAKKFKVNQVLVEATWGDGMFLKLLTPFLVKTHPVSTEEIKSNKQKELRIIDTLEPVLQQHRMVVDEALVRRDQENYNKYPEDTYHHYQLFYQLSRITKERGSLSKDDRADVLSMVVQYWVDTMDKDVRKAEEEHKAKLLDNALKKFQQHVFGVKKSSGPNWMKR